MAVWPLQAFEDNYIWVMPRNDHRTFICVDPGEAPPVIEFANEQQVTLTDVLITHHHYDHMGGVEALKNHFPKLTIYGPKDDRIPTVNHVVSDNQEITVSPFVFKILSIPGHTSTHIAYYEPNYQWLFCGDTLFSCGCGRVFDGSYEQLFASLQRIKELPDETKVYCAHEYTRQNIRFALTVEPDNQNLKTYAKQLDETSQPCSLPSTIALEKAINPFLRTHTSSLQTFAHSEGLNAPKAFDIFKYIRQLKDNFV